MEREAPISIRGILSVILLFSLTLAMKQGMYGQKLETENNANHKVDSLIKVADGIKNRDSEKTQILLEEAKQIAHDIEYIVGVIRVHNRLGELEWKRGNYSKALMNYQLTLEISKKANDKRGIASSFLNLGNVFSTLENYEKALEYLEKGAPYAAGLEDKTFLSNLYLTKGTIFLRLEKYRASLTEFEKSWEIKQVIGDESGMLFIATNIANIYRSQGDWVNAFSKLSEAKEICQRINSSYHFANINLGFGTLARDKGNYDEALQFFRKSLWYQRENNFRRNALVSYHLIGMVFRRMELADSAVATYNEALGLVVPGFQFSGIYDNPPLKEIGGYIELLPILRHKGLSLEMRFQQTQSQADLEGAFQAYRMGIRLVDTLRQSYDTRGSKEMISGRARPVYEGGIRTALELYNLTGEEQYRETAFAYSQKSKATILAEALNESGARVYAGIPDSVLKRESQLRRVIADIEKQLFEAEQKKRKDSVQLAKLWDDRFERKREYDDLVNKMEEAYPDYYQLKYDLEAVPVKRLQSWLPERMAAIDYFFGEEMLYVFAVGPAEFSIVRVPVDSVFSTLIDQFRHAVSDLDYAIQKPEEAYEAFTGSAYGLFQLLFPNELGSILENSDRCILIPDGKLHYLSFDALLYEEPDPSGVSYFTLPYLFNKWAVSYGYSIPLLIEKSLVSQAKKNYLGLAPSYNRDSIGKSGELLEFASFRENPGELKGTLEEVKRVGKLLNGITHMGPEVGERLFKEEAKKYKVLHLAMHALLNDRNPLYSKLLFAQTGDTLEDDFLNVYELYNMDLQADLAVLSACNTGHGKLVNGEGVMSLARAFRYAGCPSIVMSLWRADDQSASRMMVDFIAELRKDIPKDLALRDARRAYFTQADELTAHPYFWANFVLIGSAAPTSLTSFYSWTLPGIIGLSLLVCGFFLFRKRNMLQKKILN